VAGLPGVDVALVLRLADRPVEDAEGHLPEPVAEAVLDLGVTRELGPAPALQVDDLRLVRVLDRQVHRQQLILGLAVALDAL
jgi:hypothetical protein